MRRTIDKKRNQGLYHHRLLSGFLSFLDIIRDYSVYPPFFTLKKRQINST